MYDIKSGEVKFSGEHPDKAKLLNAGHSSDLVPKSFKEIFFPAASILSLLIFFYFFISSHRIMKGLKIHARMLASFASIIVSSLFVGAGIISAGSMHAGMNFKFISLSSAILTTILLAVIISWSHASAFKEYINDLKKKFGN